MNIKFTTKKSYGDRIHLINEPDVRVLLHRMPPHTYRRLKAVHFNNYTSRNRPLGYVTSRGRTEIAICSQAPRMSLRRPNCLKQFGALPNMQWPPLALRRYLLYNTFLHELGHLQIVRPWERHSKRRFADEKKAQAFADHWRWELYTKPFVHADPVHNAPSREEIRRVAKLWPKAHGSYKKGQRLAGQGLYTQAREQYLKALELWPEHEYARKELAAIKWKTLA